MKDEKIIALYESTGLSYVMGGSWDNQLSALHKFARAIADLQKEKDAKICEIERSKFKDYDFAASACREAIELCIDAIRSPETDLDEALRRQ